MVSNHKKKKKGTAFNSKRFGQRQHSRGRNHKGFNTGFAFDDDNDDDDDDDIFGFKVKGLASRDTNRRNKLSWGKGGKDYSNHSSGSRGTKANKKHSRLTMAEEAQFTGRHDHAVKTSGNLRLQPIQFVRSGLLNDKRDSEQKAKEINNKTLLSLGTEKSTRGGNDGRSTGKQQDAQVDSLQEGIGRVAIDDSTRATSTRTLPVNEDIEQRPPSPTPSDSSMEEVVFVGRDASPSRPQMITEKSSPVPRLSSPPPLPPLRSSSGRDNAGDQSSAQSGKQDSANPIKIRKFSPAPAPQTRDMSSHDGVDAPAKNKTKEEPMPPEWAFKDRKSGRPDPKRTKNKRSQRTEANGNNSELDDILTDYIDNMAAEQGLSDEDDELSRMLKASRTPITATEKEKTGSESKTEENAHTTAQSKSNRKAQKRVVQQVIDEDTDDEIPAEIGEILDVRERANGSVQFLISDIDLPTDEGARWVTQKLLESHVRGDELMQDFWAAKIVESSSSSNSEDESGPADESISESDDEEVNDDVNDIDGNNDDSSDKNGDDDDNDDEYEEDDDDEDDQMGSEADNLIFNDIDSSAMTDEAIARALARQEQLGLDTDDVMLFDGNEDFIPLDPQQWSKKQIQTDKNKTREVERHLERQLHELVAKPSNTRGGNKKRKSQKAERTEFPSASAFADALDQDPYGAYDIMDFERPSLRPRNKGKKAPDFQLSDEELAAQLQQSWETDRNKKNKRRQQREELRREGLLGVTNNKTGKTTVDLQMKYSRGMQMDDVGNEIRAFLLSSSENLALPPMMKRERKLVHRLANILSLTSRSRGNGASRFTVLAKNKRLARAMAVDLDIINDRIDTFVRGGSGGGGDKLLAQGGKGGEKKKNGNIRGAKASYREGDVVGASAPEIPSGNIGRMMLEKMGWISGMSLGTQSNRGILEPVSHVVKKSKAGLG